MSKILYRKFILGALMFLCVVGLVSCATQPIPHASDFPGFFMGFVHGFTIIFSFIGSLFTDVRIYAFPNSGGWYDFGFLIGVGGSWGSAGASAS